MLDLLIKNARICDGTGAPSFMGDLGVKDGVIRYVGKANGQTAERVIDADGLVLAPGFVDPHTHYDAQIAWDPLVTCSPWHGVTTVIMGNCGVGVAPVKPETREILMQDLVNVEAIPYDVMKAGIDWQWESYGQYLDAIDRRGLGINVAGLVAFTPLRHYVMGEASFERAATDGRDRHHAAAAPRGHGGGRVRLHHHHLAQPRRLPGPAAGLPQRQPRGADRRRARPADVGRGRDRDHPELRRHVRGERRGRRAAAAGSRRPAAGRSTWLALFAHPGQPDFHDQTFAKLGDLVKQAIPQVTPRPIMSQGDLKNPTMFGSFVSWQKAFNRPDGRADRALPRSRVPRGVPAGAGEPQAQPHVGADARAGSGPAGAGRPRRPHARGDRGEPGQAPGGCLLRSGPRRRSRDTRFQSSTFNFDPAGIERLITDDRCLIGLSDGGAHVDFICDVGYATALLDLWVRQRGVLSLEKAVHKLTQVPATRVRHPQPRRAGGGQGRRPGAVRPGHGDGEDAEVRLRPAVQRPAPGLRVRGHQGDVRGGHPALRRGQAHAARCPAGSCAATNSRR